MPVKNAGRFGEHQETKVQTVYHSPNGDRVMKNYRWSGCDKGGWYVVFDDDSRESDSAYYANWDSMQDAINDWLNDEE
jgi:hypothetical protein